MDPVICPIIALGMYLLAHPAAATNAAQNRLFPEGKKSNSVASKFSSGLKVIIKLACTILGIALVLNLGAHSLRKGAVTYCSSGSTMAPSIIAICLRAGWSLKGVENRYFRLENAMDQFLGRVVTGLDLMSGNFAILPPFFTHSNEADRTFILESKSSVVVDTRFDPVLIKNQHTCFISRQHSNYRHELTFFSFVFLNLFLFSFSLSQHSLQSNSTYNDDETN